MLGYILLRLSGLLFRPCPQPDEVIELCLTPFTLFLEQSFVDLLRDVLAELGFEQRSKVGWDVFAGVDEKCHGAFEVVLELGVGGRTWSELSCGEVHCWGRVVVGVRVPGTDEFDELKAEQGEVEGVVSFEELGEI